MNWLEIIGSVKWNEILSQTNFEGDSLTFDTSNGDQVELEADFCGRPIRDKDGWFHISLPLRCYIIRGTTVLIVMKMLHNDKTLTIKGLNVGDPDIGVGIHFKEVIISKGDGTDGTVIINPDNVSITEINGVDKTNISSFLENMPAPYDPLVYDFFENPANREYYETYRNKA